MPFQYQHIKDQILNKYGAPPEYLWKVFPDYAVFRHHDNRKWFGLLMNIKPEKLLKGSSTYKLKLPETLIIKHEIYVLDVKLTSSDIPSIYKTNGIYPGYPRSAGNWVSVILEDLIFDDFIMRLVDKSNRVTTI